jgi:ribosome-binding factor A
VWFHGFNSSNEMAKKELKNQLRRMPGPLFLGDDTLDYIEKKIDNSLKGGDEDPIKNPEVLLKT